MLRSLTIFLGLRLRRLFDSSIPFIVCLGLWPALQACRQTERTIGTGEREVFNIHLEKGQFEVILLEQRDGDLAMTLVPPTGAPQEANYFYGTNVEEKLFWKAEETGTYKLTIAPLSKKRDFRVSYKLTIQPPRQPTPQDFDRLEAQRLYTAASQSTEKASPSESAQQFESSAGKWRSSGEPALAIVTLIRLGQSFHHTDADQAKRYFERALHEAQILMNIRGQAEAACNLGLVYNDLLSLTWEDKQQAKHFLDRALELAQQAQDRKVEASTINNLGMYYLSIGEYQPAAEHFLEALARMRELGAEEEVLVLANLGFAYRSLGLKAEAERSYREALQVSIDWGDKLQQARAYNGLGRVSNSLGDGTLASKVEAKEYFKQAVARGGKTRNQQAFEQYLGTVCYELGEMYGHLGKPDEAHNNFNEALSHLQESLRLQQEQGSNKTHHTLTSLGLLYHALGKTREADRSLREALRISQDRNDPYQKASVLAAMARVARDHDNLMEAKSKIEAALKLIVLLGLRIQVPEWRSSYATSQQHFYDLQADILLRLHNQRPLKPRSSSYRKVAWEQMERSRRETLRDVLDRLGVSFSNGVAPELIRKRREVQALISQAKLPKSQLDQLSIRYQEIEQEIRRQNPRYNQLIYSTISHERMTELQQKVLKEDTILLEYALGQDRSYLWAITPATVDVLPLPPRIQIEQLALEVRQAMLGTGEGNLAGGQQEITGCRLSRLKMSERRYQDAVAKLSQVLLGPVASRLGKKRLLIVSDGILGRIPFAALPVPMLHPDPGSRLLLQDHEIAYAPSVLSLLSLRHEQGTVQSRSGSVVVIADPIFNAQHKQAAASCGDRRLVPDPSSSMLVSAADTLPNELPPVPFGDAERSKFCSAIFGRAPSSSRKELFQFQAKRSNVMNDQLSSYGNIVFYTHGIFSEGEQSLTGLALSRLNEQCEPQDYLLSLNDIYGLKLSADLVTLIACNTARNQKMRGFGIGSIAHGFMFAGASQVLGTLWDVEGPASLDLITRFYRNRSEGKSASEALHAAQLSFLNNGQTDWRLPYYWAGFVLMGEIDRFNTQK